MNNEEHISVLLSETIEGLNIKPDGIYVDLTLGRAGHSEAILKKLKTGLLIGIDQDIDAINKSDMRLKKVSNRYKLVHSNFVKCKEILEELDIDKVDGFLMDLGVSSPQFDEGYRGFSYNKDAPLDMRMNQNSSLTAEIIVNTYSFEELCRVFRNYGDERYASQIADNIIKYREIKPIHTTFELVDIIKQSKPMKELNKLGHPAKQVFQALRIEVNDELNVLAKTLVEILPLLNKGGRIAVITFHSGEDKIVKQIFKEKTVVEGNRLDGPMELIEPSYRLVNKFIVPTPEEILKNHRATSAKLRIIEKL